jgi:hypothetical protein
MLDSSAASALRSDEVLGFDPRPARAVEQLLDDGGYVASARDQVPVNQHPVLAHAGVRLLALQSSCSTFCKLVEHHGHIRNESSSEESLVSVP